MSCTLKWNCHRVSKLSPCIRISAPSIANSSRRLSTHTPTSTSTPTSTPAHTRRIYAPLRILNNPSIAEFQNQCFKSEHPAVLHSPALRTLPARHNWFAPSTATTPSSSFLLNYDYLEQYADTSVPLELTSINAQSSEDGGPQFKRFQAPLWTFLDWARSSPTTTPTTTPLRLYLAQCQLTDLPTQLQNDIPTPEIVTKAGRGDIYDTNIWIGLPPTYTPLHQDPNPNLFFQLVGNKHVRLLPPDAGLRVFARVRSQLGRDAGRGAAVFRGDEMMQGRERELLERAVWADIFEEEGEEGEGSFPGYEAVLNGGDALFIPKGWWHSIKGVGEGITASVNWWFR